mmetsp:Transcript_1438/g.3564  ORF Transcript_1438/g.3564 Transcript_1438/m.3564 type:complete len:211 (-) Transcript_1438:535-1167(-)
MEPSAAGVRGQTASLPCPPALRGRVPRVFPVGAGRLGPYGPAALRPWPAGHLLAQNLGGEVLGQLLVLAELHAIRGAALRVRAQGRDVAEHAGQGHVGTDDFHVTTVTDVVHQASPRVEVADDVAHVLLGGGDLHRHGRLHDDGVALGARLPPAVAGANLEGDRGGVHGVSRGVDDGRLHVHHREAGLDAVQHLRLGAPQDGRDELPRQH